MRLKTISAYRLVRRFFCYWHFNREQLAYQERIEKILRKRLEKKYGLKKGELDAIILEGGEKRWTWG
jgi:hypothetical protein